jgi:transcriptional regulator with XRE-family HTH domain
MTFADRLKLARTTAGLTGRGLDDRAGLSPGLASAIESGRRPNVTLDTIVRYATALGVSDAWLAFGAPPRRRSAQRARS